jgi:hypothetical protein
MSFSNQKLRAAGAIAVLVTLGLAVSCQGFFPKATLQSIALQPPTPTFAVGFQQPMQAWGTDSNNHRYQLTSGVSWQLSSPSSGTVATIDANSGTMTAVNSGTVTVTASSQGLSGTTTATVVQVVNSMTINPLTATIPNDGNTTANFTVSGVVQVANGTQTEDLTSVVTLTAYQGTTVESQIPCTYNSGANQQQCLPDTALVPTGTQQTFTILVTYGGYTGAPVSAQLTVTGQ